VLEREFAVGDARADLAGEGGKQATIMSPLRSSAAWHRL
jgi:hypothetical protein